MIATTHGQGPFSPAIIAAGSTFVAETTFDDEQQAYVAADNVRRDLRRGYRVGWRPWPFNRCQCAECSPEHIQGTMAAG